MSCGVGLRCSLDPVLLWLWYRLVAAALLRPLAWESPYDIGAALKRKKKNMWSPFPNNTCPAHSPLFPVVSGPRPTREFLGESRSCAVLHRHRERSLTRGEEDTGGRVTMVGGGKGGSGVIKSPSPSLPCTQKNLGKEQYDIC